MNISITNQMINFSVSILKEIKDIQMGNIHFIWDIRITHVIFWITVMSEIHFNSFPFSFIEAWYRFTKCLGIWHVRCQCSFIPHLRHFSSWVFGVYFVNLIYFHVVLFHCNSPFGGKVWYSFLEYFEYVPLVSYHVHAHDHYIIYYYQMRFHSLQGMMLNRSGETGDFSAKAHYFVQPLEDKILV